MPTPLAAAPPAAPTRVHGMCLEHADYHSMTGDCWKTTADFFFAHSHLPEAEARDCYQAAVELAMLNQHIRRHLAGPTP
ncbi:hypothetical protein ACWD4O_38755 [Streptomyces sp. NPDC002623]